jgi:fructokinase
MSKKVFKIAGVGEALWDVNGSEYTFGGAPANVACHCSAMGAEAYVVSCIGDDDLGKQANAFLTDHNVNTSCLHVDPAFETGVVLVDLDEKGKPEYDIKEGVAWDNIPFTPSMQALAPMLDAVCFGSLSQRNSISRESIIQFLEATTDNCLKVFDINIRLNFYTDEILLSSLRYANALKVNDEELPLLAKLTGVSGTDEECLTGILKKFDLKLAILTCGPEGALMITPEHKSTAWSPDPAPIINTVGAGDSFTATALLGYLSDAPL